MRQYRDQFHPKPRPHGSSGNVRPLSDRPLRPTSRPAPPRRPAPPPGPASFEPKLPAAAKERRHMRKAAAWRLARIVHSKPAALLAMELPAIHDLIDQKCPPKKLSPGGEWGEAMRLAAKIERLR